MGTNILFEVNDGDIIEADDVNQYENALTVDLVPRNNAGNPTPEAGDLGNAATPWKALFLGAVSAGISIIESASKLIIKTANTDTVTIGTGGIEAGSYAPGSVDTADIADDAISPAKMGSFTSNSASQTGTNTVIGNSVGYGSHNLLSATISKEGNRPVLILIGVRSGADSGLLQTRANVSANTLQLRVNRDSTEVQSIGAVTGPGSTNLRILNYIGNDQIVNNDPEPSSPTISVLDTSSASGSTTYHLNFNYFGGSVPDPDDRIIVTDIEMKVIQL